MRCVAQCSAASGAVCWSQPAYLPTVAEPEPGHGIFIVVVVVVVGFIYPNIRETDKEDVIQICTPQQEQSKESKKGGGAASYMEMAMEMPAARSAPGARQTAWVSAGSLARTQDLWCCCAHA